MDQRTKLRGFIADLVVTEGVESVIEQFSFLGSAFLLTKDAIVVAANDQAMSLLGLEKQDLYGKPVMDMVCESERPAMEARLANNDTTPYESKFVTGSGMVRFAFVKPSVFVAAGETYRLAQLTDITQEKHDSALRERTNRMMKHGAAVLILWDDTEDWSVEFVSANMDRFGYTTEDFIRGDICFDDLIAAEDRERICAEIKAASCAGMDEWQQDYRLVTADGELRWVSNRTSIRRDDNGAITHYESIVLDTTEIRVSQIELERFQRMIASAEDLLALVDQDYRYVSVNRRYAEAFDRSEKQVIGMQVSEVVGDSLFRDFIKAKLDQCLAGESVRYQEWHALPSKGRRFLDVSYSPSCEPVAAVVVAARDITELHTTHLALRGSEERYRTVVESVRDSIIVFQDDKQVYCNRRASKLTGLSLEELANTDVLSLVHPEDAESLKALCQQVMAGEVSHSKFHARLFHKSGAVRWTDGIATGPIAWNGGQAGLLVLQDLTDKRAAEEALRNSEYQFNQSFNVTAMPSCIVDISTGMTCDVNDRFVSLFGYSRKVLRGGNFLQKNLAVSNQESDKLIATLRDKGSVRDYPLLMRRKGGELLSLLVSACRIHGDCDDRFLVSFLDTSELRLEEQKLFDSLVQTVHAIARLLEHRDPYTSGHMSRVAELTVAIAQRLGLSTTRIEGLRFAAEIHDVGKIYVPAEILNRPGHISEVELEMIKTHTQVGYEIVKDIDFPWPIANVIHQHHERLDGSGYPRGLRGEEICEEAQILAVADTVEAMSSHRPYRSALPLEVALQTIEQDRGTKLNADAVDACLSLFQEGFVFSTSFE